MAACLHDRTDIVKMFLNSGTVSQATTISRNPAVERMKKMKLPLRLMGVNVNKIRMRKHTALVIASESGHIDIVKLLLENGAGSNQNEGNTAWLTACVGGHLETVEWLLEQGADASLSNPDTGVTPLLATCICALHPEIVACLFRHRGTEALCLNEARTSNGGNTACIAAASRRNPAILDMLLEHGADIPAVNLRGWTALDHASMRDAMGIPEATIMADRLLKEGAKAGPGTFFRTVCLSGGGMSSIQKLWPHRTWAGPPTKEQSK